MNNAHKYDGIDLTNQRHERLLVVKKSDSGRTRWICKCDCGNVVELSAWYFYHNKSCGCLENENKKNLGKNNIKHGMTKSILYSKYCGMKERCHNPNYRYFWRYGGRGIKVCNEWLGENGFENFVKWAYENGYDDNKKGYQQTLDRIDNDKDYAPGNCRWVTQKVQSNNRSTSIQIDYNGNSYSISTLSDKFGIPYYFIRRYIKKGFDIDSIVKLWHSKERKIRKK